MGFGRNCTSRNMGCSRSTYRCTPNTYVNRDTSLRVQARRILGPSPVDNLTLSSKDLKDTNLDALFYVLVDRRPQDPIKALNLESSEIAIEGLNLVSRYLDGNLVLESLHLGDVSFVLPSLFSSLTQFTHLNQTTNQAHSKSRNDVAAFVAAVNQSHIDSLSLAFNSTLRDLFLSSLRFYTSPSRYLRNIKLSGIDYTLDELSIPSAAFRLLTLSRVLMLDISRCQLPLMSNPHTSPNTMPICSPLHGELHASRPSNAFSTASWQDPSQNSSLSWQFLPVELQLQILQYVAPILSYTQITCIVNYAADSDTLPRADNTEMMRREHWLDMVGCSGESTFCGTVV
jgi:hypothetical protein